MEAEVLTQAAYSATKSISGGMNYIALSEYLHTFRNGKPCESWTNQHSTLRLEDIMSIEIGGSKIQTPAEPPDWQEKSTVEDVNELAQILSNPSRMVEV